MEIKYPPKKQTLKTFNTKENSMEVDINKNEESRQSPPQHEKVISTEYTHCDENGNLCNGVRIHPEFEALIYPLAREEYFDLEESLKTKGCLDPIKVWQGYIVDGHHRHKICKEKNITYEVLDMDFEDEWQVKKWMIDNQLGRRNLTDVARIEYALMRVDIIRGLAQRNQETSRFGQKEECSLDSLPHKTRRTLERRVEQNQAIVQKAVARNAGVSVGTVARYNYVKQHADEETLKNLREGKLIPFDKKNKKKKLSIGEVYRKIKAKEKNIQIVDNKKGLKKYLRSYPRGLDHKSNLNNATTEQPKKPQVKAISRKELSTEDIFTRIVTHPIDDLHRFVDPDTIDVIITEPPCKEEDIDLFDKLGDFARHALKAGAPCVVIAGNQFLPDFIEMLRAHLDYCWTLSFNASQGFYEAMGAAVDTGWKPILVFSKGEPNLKPFSDCADSLEDIVESFSYVGETICDPFCNNGSIGRVCLEKRRSFIGSDISIEKTLALKESLQLKKA